MKKVVSFCIFSVLLAVLSLGVKAQTPSGLTLSPANVTPQVGVQDTVYLIPDACFDALGLTDDDKISIEWEILKDGARIETDSLTRYFVEFKFETRYNIGNTERWWGRSYTDDYCYNGNGFGSFPGAYTPLLDSLGRECARSGHFCITLPGQNNPYEFDYFYVRFFKDAANSAHRLIFEPREDGNYEIVIHLYRRCNGTKWDNINCNNDQRYYVGGHTSDLCGELSSDTLKPMPDTIPMEVSICVGQTYTLNGQTFDHDTTDAFVPFNGTSSCGASIDSVINLTLHVIDPLVPIFDTLNSITQLCDSGDVTLTAIPQNAGTSGSCIWYDALGNVIDTNNTITQHITANAEFYAFSYNPEGGCTSLDSVRVFAEVYATPNPHVTADTTEQCEEGAVTLTLDQAYDTFNWFHGDNQLTETSTTLTLDPIALADSGIYYATVIDTNYHSVYNTAITCPATSDSVNIVVYEHATATIVTFDGDSINTADNGIFCMTDTLHVVTAEITGGTAPYTLNWSNTSAYVTYNTTGDTVTFSPNPTCDTTIYNDTIIGGTDAHNCSIKQGALVDVFFTLQDQDVPHIYVNGDSAAAFPSTSTNCSYLMPDLTPLIDSIVDACGTTTWAQTIAANTEIFRDTTAWIVATDNCGHQDSTEIRIAIQPNFATVTITTFDGDSITAADNGIFCMTDVDHVVTADITGGTAPFTLNWSNATATHTISGTIATVTFTGTPTCDTITIADTILSGTDARGCDIIMGNLIDVYYVLEDTDVPHIYMNRTDTTAEPSYDGDCSYLVPDVTALVDSVTDACGTVTWAQSIAADTRIYRDTTLWVVATDNCGHKDSTEVTITIPYVHVSATDSVFQHVICSGDANGIVDIMVKDGVRPYSVTINLVGETATYTQTGGYNADTTFRFEGLVKGLWAVAITDANGCTYQADTLDVSSPNILELDTANVTNLTCWKNASGYFDYQLTGGSMPYVVKLEGPVAKDTTINDNNTYHVGNLDAGDYVLSVVDGHDCKDTIRFTLTEPDSLQITALTILNHVKCYGESNGNMAVAIAGGTADYTFTWNDSLSNAVRTETRSDLADTTGRILPAGVYTIHVTDVNNCPCVDWNDTIKQNDSLQVVSIVTPNATECPYQGTYDVTATVAGGTTNHTFTWTVNGTEYAIASNSNLTDTYTYTETDPAVCDTTFNITFKVVDDSLCEATKNADQFQIVDNTNPVIAGAIADTIVIGCGRDAATVPAPVDNFTDLIALGLDTITDNCTTVAADFTVTFADDTADVACFEKAKATIQRTYTVADKCGNASTVSYKITVKDTVAPTFTRPDDITIYKDSTCNADITVLATGDATNVSDNCLGTLNATYTDETIASTTCVNTDTIKRTWHLVDECGNAAADQVQIITIVDTIRPWFIRAPKNDTSYCDVDNLETVRARFKANISYADNCGTPDIVIALDSIDTLCNNKTTIEYYSFTLTDACGLTTTAYAQIYTMDTVPPVLTHPWFKVTIYDCATSDEDYLNWKNNIDIIDHCNDTCWLETFVYDRTYFSPSCTSSFIDTAYWYFTDGCNVDSAMSVFTINDITPPYMAVGPQVEVEVECDGAGNLDTLKNWLNHVQYIDECDDDITVEIYCISGTTREPFDTTTLVDGKHYNGWQGTDCDGRYTIEWIAKDCGGNQSTPVIEHFRIIDRVGPQFNAPNDTTIECTNWETDYANWLDVPNAFDQCQMNSDSVVHNNSEGSASFYNGCYAHGRNIFGTAFITFTAKDACGNITTEERNFTIIDTVAPVVTLSGATMPDLHIYYRSDCNLEQTFTDTLAGITWWIDTLTSHNPNELADFLAAHTELGWTNISDCAYPLGAISVTRNSDVPELLSETACEKTYLISYIVKDHCGNPDTLYQKVILGDTTKPKGSNFADTVYVNDACSFTVPLYTTVAQLNEHHANITDCPDVDLLEVSAPSYSYSGSLVGCDSIIYSTYTISDQCGNSIDVVDTIYVMDTTRPVITGPMPSDIVYMNATCDGITSDTAARYAALMDTTQYAANNWTMQIFDCSGITITRGASDITEGDCPEKTILTTFTVSDGCGNESQFVDTLYITDTVKPVVSNYEHNDTIYLVEPGCTFTVPDEILNIATYKDLYNHESNYFVTECRLDSNALVTAADDATLVGDTTAPGCTRIVHYYYKVQDLCGNISDGKFTLNVVIIDTTRPAVAATTVENDTVYLTATCQVPDLITTYWADGSDAIDHGYSITDCNINAADKELVRYTQRQEEEGCNNIKVTVPYTIADSCGNVSDTLYQYIIAVDTVKPVVDDSYINTIDTAQDANCGVYALDTVLDIDTYKKLYDFDNNYTVTECKLDSTKLITDHIDTTDDACERYIHYYYRVQDACGNISANMFTLSVKYVDKLAPLVTAPATLREDTVYMTYPECTNTDTTGLHWPNLDSALAHGYTFTDCHLYATTFTQTRTAGWQHDGCYSVDTVYYTVADSCHNVSVEFIQAIRMLDTSVPVVQTPTIRDSIIDMDETTADCLGHDVDPFTTVGQVIAFDATFTVNDCNVDDASEVFVYDADTAGISCERVVTRVYKVKDNCGNVSNTTFTHKIKIQDVTAPVLSFTELPGDTSYMNDYADCDLNANAEFTSVADLLNTYANYSVTDCNLDDAITCVADTSYTALTNLPYVATIHRVYTISDTCGHSTDFTHDIFVRDTNSPIITTVETDALTNLPKVQDSIVYSQFNNCDPDVPAAFTTVAQALAYPGMTNIVDCELDSTLTSTYTETDGSCPDTIARTYTVVDSTGNTAQFMQYIIIRDTVRPVISGTLPTALVYTDDNCDFDLSGVQVYYDTTDLEGAGLTIVDCHDITSVNYTDVPTRDPQGCENENYVTRTYTITDKCGNSSTVDQIINIQDTTRPQMDVPALDDVAATSMGGCKFAIPDLSSIINAHYIDNCTSLPKTITPDHAWGELISDTTIVTITYTDSCDNANTTTIRVNVPAKLVIDSVKMDSVSCHSMSDGSILVWISGGTDNDTVSIWQGTTQVLGDSITDNYMVFHGLAAGTYTVQAIDADSCEAVPQNIEVLQPDTLVVSLAVTDLADPANLITSNCDNVDFRLVTELPDVAQRGTPDYVYTWFYVKDGADTTYFTAWNTNTAVSSTSITSPALSDFEEGEYKFVVEVVDARGCSDTASATLTVYPTYEFHDTSRVCLSNLPFTWAGHTDRAIDPIVIDNSVITVNDTVYEIHDSLLTIHGCDSVWILHLTVTDKAFLTIRDRNDNADESSLQEREIHATFETGNYADGQKGFEIFVDRNCMNCTNVKVGFHYTLYRIEGTDTIEITSDVDDYFTPNYRTYMDQYSLNAQTITTGPVVIPQQYPTIGMGVAAGNHYNYFNLCWMTPRYNCSFGPFLTNSGIGYTYGRANTIGFTQFRTPGEYMIVVDMVEYTGGSGWNGEGYCHDDGKVGGQNATATTNIISSVTIYMTVTGDPLSASAPFVNPMEGVVTVDALGNVPTVTAYPNPARDFVTVELSGFHGETSVILSDGNGKALSNTNLNIDSDATPIIKINTSDFAQGVYMVTARNKDVVVTKRVVIVR